MTAYVSYIGIDNSTDSMVYGSFKATFRSDKPTFEEIEEMNDEIDRRRGITGCVIQNIIPVSESED